MKEINILGIDLAKKVFQLHGNDFRGKVVLKKKLNRSRLKEFIANLPVCLIAMEACGGAHYWAREFKKLGHEVKLIAPQFVKPFVKANKNDAADAEAIAEAAARPNMRFVGVKPIGHQDIQSIHRVRQRLIHNRTALSNEIRGLLNEYGIVFPKNLGQLKKQLPLVLEDASSELTPMSRELFAGLLEELRVLEVQIGKYDRKILQLFAGNEACQRIGEIEGIGPITATAIVAVLSEPRNFKNGRQFSAYLGLVPKQNSSGGKTVLLGISKRGDRYIRTLLIHGARSVVNQAKSKNTRRSRWIMEKKTSRGFNKACVALANKNARVIWALLATGEVYKQAA